MDYYALSILASSNPLSKTSIVSLGVQLLRFDPTNSTQKTFGIGVNTKLTDGFARVLNHPTVKTKSPAPSWNM